MNALAWFGFGMLFASLLCLCLVAYSRRLHRDEPWATQEQWDRRKPGLDLDRLDHPQRKTGEL